MKVGFLGNMNNAAFATVQYLRDAGIDAELMIYDGEFDHFHPSADTYDLSYRDYVRQLGWGSPSSFLSTTKSQIIKDTAPYDLLVGNGLAAAYLHRIGRALDVMVPYGDDLWVQTFYRLVSPQRIPSFWYSVWHQRRGLPQCGAVAATPLFPTMEAQVQRYLKNAVRWQEGVVPIHGPTYSPERMVVNKNRTHWWVEFTKLREANEFLAISPVRHVWTRSDRVDAKGTDSLLHGWAMFRAAHPKVKATLMTLEYGQDVAASKRLIDELGIGDSVRWLPKMFRKDLMVGMCLADVVCGYFGPSWITGGVLTEAMVAEKPILGWRDDSSYRDFAPGFYPMMKAREPSEIAGRLGEYLADPAAHRAMGQQSALWYRREIVRRALDHYKQLIGNRKQIADH